QTVKAHDPAVNRHVLAGDPDVTAANFSVFDQPAGHKFRRVTADGEADALRRPDHCRVYAHDFTRGIDQWSTGITGIKRSVGLNDVVDQAAGLRMHGSTHRADDPGGYAGFKPKRISDRDDELAYSQIVGICQAHVRQLRRIDSDN